MSTRIEWRSAIEAAPRTRRILMIAKPIVPGHADVEPEIVVAHGYEGAQRWVIANTFGEPRKDARLPLIPMYGADLGELPPDVIPRRLDIEDFKG